MAASRYFVPAGTHRVADEIRRSRFITTLARAASVAEAQLFIQQVRDEFPDATHHCWAYVVGPPGTTAQIGMSDDGEPHGTAGRPMLNALLHADVGDVAAVVTRYYGGTNLGTGGLVRAYGGGVIRALETLPRIERIAFVAVSVALDYARVSAFEQIQPGESRWRVPARASAIGGCDRVPLRTRPARAADAAGGWSYERTPCLDCPAACRGVCRPGDGAGTGRRCTRVRRHVIRAAEAAGCRHA